MASARSWSLCSDLYLSMAPGAAGLASARAHLPHVHMPAHDHGQVIHVFIYRRHHGLFDNVTHACCQELASLSVRSKVGLLSITVAQRRDRSLRRYSESPQGTESCAGGHVHAYAIASRLQLHASRLQLRREAADQNQLMNISVRLAYDLASISKFHIPCSRYTISIYYI